MATTEMAKGQRVSYRVYKTTYSLSVDDSSVTTESVRHGIVHSVTRSPRFVQVRDDASGRIVNVLNHRIIRTPDGAWNHAFLPLSGSQDAGGAYTRCGVHGCTLSPEQHGLNG